VPAPSVAPARSPARRVATVLLVVVTLVPLAASAAAGASHATGIHRLGADGGTVVYAALGDSVPAGYGLDWHDVLGDDPCWRGGGRSYPGKLEGRLEDELDVEVDRHLLACSGASTGDLLEEDGQVDDAVALQPDLVTVTIGANDLGFVHPERLVAGGHLDDDLVDERLAAFGDGLAAVLHRLVTETDAVVVVTTYHDPAGPDPVGVDGCSGSCFSAIAATVTADLDGRIADVVAGAGRRVVLADVRPAFDGHGAPNGWGPDRLRELGVPGWLSHHLPGRVVDALDAAQGVQAYCAAHHDWHIEPNWVNGLDCVHPNEDGAREYARLVDEALARARAV
jgi:lysophospholipase L1-like esterase